MEHGPSFTFALALGAGVAAQLVSRHLRLPSIVLLLATGVALGPDGLRLVEPRALGADGLFGLVSLAVAIILFEGGLNLNLARLRREGAAIRRLVILGAAITAIGAGLAAQWIMGWPPGIAFLFGTLVIVTGPTVIRPLLRNVPLRPRVATVLEAEGLLIDPVGAIVAAVALQVVTTAGDDAVASGVLGLAARVAFGAGAGLGLGLGLAQLLRQRRAVPEGLENLVALGGALLGFELCESVLPESGILAVTVAGVVVGNLESRIARELGEFQEHLTVGLIGLLFVLLAADVRVADVVGLGLPGLLTVAAVALIVRPVNVWVCTAGTEFSSREKAFVSWIGPRGVVAAAIASISAAFLDEFDVGGGAEVRALVFLTIALTVVVQGGTAPLVARLLGVRAPGRDSIVILGAEELAFALAGLLRQNTRVVFSDVNPTHCRAAEERGYPVIYGNALQERTLARMRLERARVVIGLTTNNEVNAHFTGEARDAFGVRETYVAVNREGSEVTKRVVEKQESRVLFDRPKDVDRWQVRLRHGSAEVLRFRYFGPPEEPDEEEREEASKRVAATDAPEVVDPYVILAVKRGEEGSWTPMYQGFQNQEGDLAAVALYTEEATAAAAALRAMGWERAPEEDLGAPDPEEPPPGNEGSATTV